jgi:REP element-mobilizing transposase RayT
MSRGVSKQTIFYEDSDCEKYLDVLMKLKGIYEFRVYAFCLMGNHVHLLIDEKEEDISVIMQSLNTTYASWFNRKYNRYGHLFQDRFKSKPVEDKSYLKSLVRYIHFNPIRSGKSKTLRSYRYSSYNEYISEENYLVDTDFIWNLLGKGGFRELHESYDLTQEEINIENENEYLKLSEIHAREIVCRIIGNENPLIFTNLQTLSIPATIFSSSASACSKLSRASSEGFGIGW